MSLERMPEANFGPEARQTVTPEISAFNQLGIVIVELPQPKSPSVVDRFKDHFHGFVDKAKAVAKRYGAVPAVGAIALVAAVACSGGDQNNDIRIDTQTSTPTAGASLEPTPRITPTSESTPAQSNGGNSDGKSPTPTATSTPEVKQEVPCLIVATELCKTAELLEVELGGSVVQVIGLKLPVNTEVFSFRGGTIFKPKLKEPFRGVSILVGDDVPDKSKPSISLIGDFTNVKEGNTANAGDVIATIQDAGNLNFGYNLLVSVNTLSTDDSEAVLRGLFPDAFSQPVKKVTLDQAKNSSPTYSGSSVIPK